MMVNYFVLIADFLALPNTFVVFERKISVF